jgi:hypothetical protein
MIALAKAGPDTTTSIKQATEFGIDRMASSGPLGSWCS